MAIKLSRDLKQQTTSPEGTGTSKGFDISGTPGVNYDIEKVKRNKDRKDPGMELLAELTGNGTTVGSMSIKKEEENIFATNTDMKNYLFKNEPSTDASASIALRRSIILFEEGTPDKNKECENESIYDTMFSLQDQVKSLMNELSKMKESQISEIELYKTGNLKSDVTSIPTTGAVYDFVKQYIRTNIVNDDLINDTEKTNLFRQIFSNSELNRIDTENFSVNYEEDYYKILSNKDGTFSLILGGYNE